MHHKKVLFVTASTVGGGAERQLINIINSIADDSKYCLKLIITSSDPLPIGLNSRVECVRWGFASSKVSFGRLHEEIGRFKPNYVFTTSGVLANMLVVLKWLSINKFNIVVRIAVTPSERYITSLKDRLSHYVSATILKYANIVVAQTEFMKNDIRQCYGIKSEKIIVIRNLVDQHFLDESSSSYVAKELDERNYNLVAAGALYSIKGFDLLIRAFERVLIDTPNAKLYILGEERYEAGYTDYLHNLIKSKNNIFLLGQKSNPYPYFKAADLFVLSSRKEGFPNVVLESLSLGTPVVATNCVDFDGVIQIGKNGYVVNKESEDALYDGITQAINNLSKPIVSPIHNFNYKTIFH